MATKAELEVELALLRKKLAEGAEAVAEGVSARAPSELADMLKTHGSRGEDVTAALDKLSVEIANLPRTRPLLTVAGAFALGFILGRASRS